MSPSLVTYPVALKDGPWPRRAAGSRKLRNELFTTDAPLFAAARTETATFRLIQITVG